MTEIGSGHAGVRAEFYMVARIDKIGHKSFLQPSGIFGLRETAERYASTTAAWKAADKINAGGDALLVIPTKER